MPNNVLEFYYVGKEFTGNNGQPVTALASANLVVREGDFISVMGPSGSGKTTLANIAGLLTTPSSGSVVFLGQNCEFFNNDQLTNFRSKHIGYIFQDYMLIEHMNVLQNVALSQIFARESMSKIYNRAREILARVGLEKKIHSLPRQLSGGQKQRVAIARALLKNPMLILADEPAGALDPISRVEILGMLQELNQAGSTIMMVTHNKEDAEAGSRLVRVESARIVSDQPIQDRKNFIKSR